MAEITAFLGIGSNQGDKEGILQQGVAALNELPRCSVTAVSSLYLTAPQGYLEQEDFLNAVVRISTCLEPLELLDSIHEIEKGLGRVRTIHWGPRTLDIDILLFGEEEIALPRLTVPHPRLTERAFVLYPLAEIVPEILILGIPISTLLDRVKQQKISLFKREWFVKL